MIDVENERLVSFHEASKHLPGNPCYSTIQRWKTRTINPLETIKYGGRIFTSLEALERFACKCTSPTCIPSQTTKARQRELDKAERELAMDGI